MSTSSTAQSAAPHEKGRSRRISGTPAAHRSSSPPPLRSAPSLRSRLRKDWQMLVLMIPGAIALLLFFYVPILGNVIAFQDYQPYYSITEAPFVGFEKFLALADDSRFLLALRNTMVYAAFQLVLFFPLPILLALIVDSVMSPRMRKAFQSIVYLPHFLSWVLVIALFQQMLGGAGLINQFLMRGGLDPIPFMTNSDSFALLIVVEVAWKDAGWGMIIFLAALSAIDQSLYESAAADGAGRVRRTWHITLPGMRPVIVLLLILNLGSILTVGFEQFILQRDAVGADTAEVLDTYSYYTGVIGGDWSMGAAAGLAKGVVGTVLILIANKVAHMLGEDGIYRGRPQ
ncbi:sugar ABC transporter permease [Brachybacterium sp. FME24]|uniref:ABC transporter permease n=1 Tax=Brachybacterium sp. FME24 TaxID=2742605 RepID=UPI002714928C|nr:ABC transporter permease subunit [Brachybacterium sp. FME24]